MKRIITLIVALMTIAAGANADDRTVVSVVEATSTDYASICVVGASVSAQPTVQITKGAPAYFYFYSGKWYKKKGTNSSMYVKEGLFTEGTWFFRCQLRVDGDAGKTHRLSENTVVKINGKTCKITDLRVYDTYSYCYVDWPEMTITGKLDNRTEISLIEATSSNYKTIPALGTSVTTKPTVSITTGTQARFDVASGYWAKQIYQGGGFTSVTSGEFSVGTWCYFCNIWIDGTAGKSYRLSDNLKVKINNEYCDIEGVVIVDKDYSYVKVMWPEIDVEKTKITRVDVTSTDYASIPVIGSSLRKPTATVTTGSQARMVTEEGCWCKESGSGYDAVGSGLFTEGTWWYYCELRVDGEAGKAYQLTKNTIVNINGHLCQVYENGNGSDYSSINVFWPEIKVNDNRTVISVVEAGSNFENYLKAGKTLKELGSETFNITTGKPATAVSQSWYKYDETSGSWKAVMANDVLTSGKYRWHVGVGLSGNNRNSYVLSSDFKLKVNGVEWTREGGLEEGSTYCCYYFNSPSITLQEMVGGTLGTQGMWEIKDGVLTINYNGDMPQDVTLKTTDPEKAYRLVFEPYLKQIKEVVIKGHNVGVQPYLFYFSGDGPDGSHPDDNIKKITIGSGVKSVGKQAFVVYNLEHFYTYCETPPTLSSDASNGTSNKVFWWSRIKAKRTYLHTLTTSGVWARYCNMNTEWYKCFINASDPYGVGIYDLYPENDPDYGIYGDLNGDGKVDIADAVTVLNIMAASEYKAEADLNGDNKVDIADFVTILNIMAAQ